ncbi:MAG: DUF1203 domain-containing protein [Alphaproteobacteria bacterium]
MIPYRAIPIPTAVAETARTALVDSYGNALKRHVAQSHPGAPCRHCLADVGVGEGYVTMAYSAFTTPGPYSEVGPIFLHAERCPAFDRATNRLPEIVRLRTVAIRGYNAAHEIEAADLVEGEDAESLIERLLENPAVAYLHARTARYGCYLCRIERA